MAAPLLATKVYRPRSRDGAVPRRRLLEQLDRAGSATLTLVSAPAGFGKTTLVSQWLDIRSRSSALPVAWVSLDEGDSDPSSFLSYLLSALRTVVPQVGAEELALLLQGDDDPPIRRLVTTVLNDLNELTTDVVLVLDDYHVISSMEVHEEVTYLVDHAPPQLHVVIVTRTDPAIPLARLRARGQLVELRAADLRFTAEEAASYLNHVMGLGLLPAQVAALEARTEGWIAALQLAALSMQGRDDVAGFIAGFTGDDRFIVDYLVEEVLQRQPEPVQRFLLQTSILDRLTGPLCDAVTGQPNGKATLESLDRANLFLVPLDDRRRWYRYHHLFAEVLHARLLDERPREVATLHQCASAWYDENDDRAAAIRHALAAADFERAAELIEREFPASRRDRRESTLLGWLQLLPDDVVQNRPVLSVVYAGTLLSTGTHEGVEQRLEDAERWLRSADDEAGVEAEAMVVIDSAELRRLPAWVAIYRAALALLLGDPEATARQAQEALLVLAPDDDIARAAASALNGLAAWNRGDLLTAHQAYSTCSEIFLRSGYLSDVLGCAITLGDIRVTQGRLQDAMATYEQSLLRTGQRGMEPPGSERPGPRHPAVIRGAADMHVAMAMLHREHGDLDAAHRCLQVSQALGEHNGLPQNRYRWRVAMARVREAEGDLDAAVALLQEAEQSYVGDFLPQVRPIPAFAARLHVRQGRLEEATGWVQARRLSPEDHPDYLAEFEHLTLARVLIARLRTPRAAQPEGRGELFEQTVGLLHRLRAAAEAGDRTGSVIEALVLEALARQTRGDVGGALVPLRRALELAEPEGYVRIFLDEGPTMTALLGAASDDGITPAYVRHLLGRAEPRGSTSSHPRRAGAEELIEPLSDRERDVLRLLATDLAGPEIARELVLSLNTVRTHTRNIYAKLGVSGRRAAVRRAHDLDLLRVERRTH